LSEKHAIFIFEKESRLLPSSIRLFSTKRQTKIFLYRSLVMIDGKDSRQQMATAFRSIPQSFPLFAPLEIAPNPRRDEAESDLSQLHRLLSILDAALEIVAGEPSPAEIIDMGGEQGSKLGSDKQ
jgi:hypothetical protein